MRNNKIIKFAAIALLSAFALTACDDEIIAKPTGYDDNSPVVDLDKEVYNNNFKDIYDSIRNGSLSSDVLDELLAIQSQEWKEYNSAYDKAVYEENKYFHTL